MKKIIFVLIMMISLSTLTFSQTGLSSGFSFEGGLGTSHAPSFICLNYNIHLNDNAKDIYFLEIETDNRIINKKLILK